VTGIRIHGLTSVTPADGWKIALDKAGETVARQADLADIRSYVGMISPIPEIMLVNGRAHVFGVLAANSGIANANIIQAAVDWCIANGYYELYLPNIQFSLASPGVHTFTTPGDDGSYPPGWPGETTLAAETVYQMPVAVKVNGRLTFIGQGRGTEIIGPWNYLTGTVDVNQTIAFLFTSPSGKIGAAQGGLKNLRIRNFLSAQVHEGITKNFHMVDLSIAWCGFAGIMQGNDTNTLLVNITLFDCWATFIVGGWWLYRASANVTISEVWPYTGHLGEASGWCDRLTVDNVEVMYNEIEYTGIGGKADQIDEFFNTYFFKSLNSARTGTGPGGSGRLTVTDSPTGFPAVMHAYWGVTGRAITIANRYGRAIFGTAIHAMKTRCLWRQVLQYSGNLTEDEFRLWYVEDSGYAKPRAGGGAASEANTVGGTGGPTDRYRGALVKLPAGLVARAYGAYINQSNPRIPSIYSYSNPAPNVPAVVATLPSYHTLSSPGWFTQGLFVTAGTPTLANKLNAVKQDITFAPKLYFGTNEQTNIPVGTRVGTAVQLGDEIWWNMYIYVANPFTKIGTGNAELRFGTGLLTKALRITGGSYAAVFHHSLGMTGSGILVGRFDAPQSAGADLTLKLRLLNDTVATQVTDAHFAGTELNLHASGMFQLAADA
jgi:hypothetical protein